VPITNPVAPVEHADIKAPETANQERMEFDKASRLSMEIMAEELAALREEKAQWQAKMDAALIDSKVPHSGPHDNGPMQESGYGGASGSGIGSLEATAKELLVLQTVCCGSGGEGH
jgi:hypothetical protein